MDKDAAFQLRLMATFKVEAAEHLSVISSGLVDLEKTSTGVLDPEVIEVIFREIHSLKGAARTVNQSKIEAVCRSLENFFSILKRGPVTISPDLFNRLYQALDLIQKLLAPADAGQVEPEKSALSELIAGVDRAAAHLAEEPTQAKKVSSTETQLSTRSDLQSSHTAQPTTNIGSETIRIEKAKLNSVMLRAEGLLQTKQALEERTSELRQVLDALKSLVKRWDAARSEVRILGRLLQNDAPDRETRSMITPASLFDFIESGREHLKDIQGRLAYLETRMAGDHRSVGSMIDGLVEDTKQISMTPFATLLDILPRAVRDLLSRQGKQAELTISGSDVQVDRRILEELKDPLIHLIRNCADHGIETPDQRMARGKPATGRITVSVVYRDSGKVELILADDGPGINLNQVKRSAVRLGLVSPEDAERLDEDRLRAFIFRSGVSTSVMVTDTSGLGLGLAIVQEKVEKLGGTISAESAAQTGTVFRILLPLTLATLRGLLVRLENRLFVIPTVHIRRATRLTAEDVRTIEGRATVGLDGSILPLIRPENLLELPSTAKSGPGGSLLNIVVLEAEKKCMALWTDEVLYEHEFTIKGLGRQLKRVRNISGATVLSGGVVVPILNVYDMMKSAVESPEDRPSAIRPAPEDETRRSILVAEDSVTARTLLKNILEAAGYEVKTAVNGINAFSLLRAEAFDLVVSDVDMPKMNGFELTARIRSDKNLAELPVILVTALESRQDRERGIDVGANAYIVKSSFDQSNLLGVIERFIS